MTAAQAGEDDLIFAEQSGQKTDRAEQCSADDCIGEIDSVSVCGELSGAARGHSTIAGVGRGAVSSDFFPKSDRRRCFFMGAGLNLTCSF